MSNLSNFTKRWLTATCAPESITTFTLGLRLVHKLVNENLTKSCWIIECPNEVFFVSDNSDLKRATVLEKCNLDEALHLAIELLGLKFYPVE